MGSYQQRILENEIMDDPALDPDEHRAALDGLNHIQRWTGCARSLYRVLRRLRKQLPVARAMRVIDLGCADGWMGVEWLQMAHREGLLIHYIGMDNSIRAIEWAKNRAKLAGFNADYICGDILQEPLPAPADVVVASLFMHHLRDDQILELLKRIHRVQPSHLVIHDLDRSRCNALFTHVAAHALSSSPVVHVDADRSMAAALTRSEMQKMVIETGFHITSARRSWPCRFCIEATCTATVAVVREREALPSLVPNPAGTSMAYAPSTRE